jgi:hypothetical protein
MTKKVELSFVLDETGSMEILRKDTIGSFNTFVEEQRKLDADMSFSLVLFSLTSIEETYRLVHESVPLDEIVPLTERSYRPRGTTPLLDAIGSTIDGLGARLVRMPEKDRPDQVIVVILTDGLENASREYTIEQVKEKIAHQRDVYKWEFVFMGCGIDAFDVAGGLNISAAYTTSHEATAKGIREAYNAASFTVSTMVDEGSTTV